jgi:hypothetical protein
MELMIVLNIILFFWIAFHCYRIWTDYYDYNKQPIVLLFFALQALSAFILVTNGFVAASIFMFFVSAIYYWIAKPKVIHEYNQTLK